MKRADWVIASAGAMLFAVAFTYPVLARLGDEGLHGDWDFFWHLHWVAYDTVRRFGQFPLWNPYRCGGSPLFANPQASIFTPFFLLDLAAGPVVGVHLAIALHYAIAWCGGYVLGRTVHLSRLGALATASIFAAGSWLSLHLAGGHLWVLPAAYLPFVAAGLWTSIERGTLLPAALAGLCAALTILEGGPYITAQAALLAAIIALTASVLQRRLWPLCALAALGAFSFGFAAIKLLPMWEFTRAHPRPMDFHEWNGAGTMLAAFLSRDQDYHREFSARYTFVEYGAYVGLAGAALAALGLFAPTRARLPWVIALVAFVLFAVGDGGTSLSPAGLLHRVPPFTTERAASRFHIPAVLAIGVLAGFGVDRLRRRRGRMGLALAMALVAAHLADAWIVGTPNLNYVFEGTQPTLAGTAEFQQHRNTPLYESMSLLRANQGAIVANDCVMGGDRSSVVANNDAGYGGEQHVSGSGSAVLASWSPNVLTYEVDMSGPGVLVVNQNFDPAWRLARGTGRVLSAGGLLGVKLAAGRQTIALRYADRTRLGAVISLLSCVAAALLFRGERAARRKSSSRSPLS